MVRVTVRVSVRVSVRVTFALSFSRAHSSDRRSALVPTRINGMSGQKRRNSGNHLCVGTARRARYRNIIVVRTYLFFTFFRLAVDMVE